MDINPILLEIAQCFTGELSDDKDVAFPEQLDRHALDYSLDSLHAVDTYLDYLHAHRDAIEEAWGVTVVRAGAYVGEVLRRHADGDWTWIDYNDYMPQHPDLRAIIPERTAATCALLHNGQGAMRLPLNKIARYVEEGPDNNTHFFVSCDVRQ